MSAFYWFPVLLCAPLFACDPRHDSGRLGAALPRGSESAVRVRARPEFAGGGTKTDVDGGESGVVGHAAGGELQVSGSGGIAGAAAGGAAAGGASAQGGAIATTGGNFAAGGISWAGRTSLDDAGAAGEVLPRCEPLGEDDPTKVTRFAVFGDYGREGPDERSVADLVKSFGVDFIVTAGDNNYPVGGADTIDLNVGQEYAEFICPYRGKFGRGARKNRFFPALGNHDWYTAGAKPYLDYFELPGNERYYDFVWGSVHLFVVDSDPSEPDGVLRDSVQATWLSQRLAASNARWKIVVMHHPPYSSGLHGSAYYMQWPFQTWGAHLVFAGHDHDYERIDVDGLPVIVVGLGGASTYGFNTTVAGSRVQFNSRFGAGLVEADQHQFSFRFFSVENQLIDSFSLGEP
ncbi:MAG: metallophosphoesterase family protein [Myxococcota bacterium]